MTSLKVAVRVRPLSERESISGSKVVVDVHGRDVLVTDVKVPEYHGYDHRVRVHRFTFDYGFWSVEPASKKCASQRTVYEEFGRVVLNTLLEGYNSCVIAYGPSGSGKTYTMMGTKEETGLTPRICEGLFMKLTDQTDHHLPFQIDISFMELYNEQVFDLLQKNEVQNKKKPKLRIREHPVQGPFVEGLSTHAVKNIDEVCDLLARGNEERVKAATHIHERSSRSHAIFTIRCSQACLDHTKPREVASKLHLVDLAGSEKVVPEFCQNRVKEGGNINKSLVTLGNVIAVLVEMSLRSKNGDKGRKQIYVPYRDSHLTWLLKDSLGGNSHTFMLAAISPSKECYIETVSTLRYAQRAKLVMNRPVVNEDTSTEVIRNLRNEVARLRSLLSTAEELSKAYIMKPLPEIMQLRSIMKESAMKVDILTKHWFEKWLQTYDVVINKFETLDKENLDIKMTELGKNTDVSPTSFLDSNLSTNSNPSDSSECVIMGNEVVSFFKTKFFKENDSVSQQKEVQDILSDSVKNEHFETKEFSENMHVLKNDFTIGKKDQLLKTFESVSENMLQTCKLPCSVVPRSMSLSQSHMVHPFGVYSWLVNDEGIKTESHSAATLPRNDRKCSTGAEDCCASISGTFDREQPRLSIFAQNSPFSAAEERQTDHSLGKIGSDETPEIAAYLESSCEEDARESKCCNEATINISPNWQCEHFSTNTRFTEPEEISSNAIARKEILKTAPKLDFSSNGLREDESNCDETIKCTKDASHEKEIGKEIATHEVFNSKELKWKMPSEVLFSERVREESNNMVELLKMVGHESTESSSGCCSPKRKDSEIMSLLSFSSLDGQYFRSLDDFTSNEETASVSGHVSELRRDSMLRESVSSCSSDVNGIRSFQLQLPENGELTSEAPLTRRLPLTSPLSRRLNVKELSYNTFKEFGRVNNETISSRIYDANFNNGQTDLLNHQSLNVPLFQRKQMNWPKQNEVVNESEIVDSNGNAQLTSENKVSTEHRDKLWLVKNKNIVKQETPFLEDKRIEDNTVIHDSCEANPNIVIDKPEMFQATSLQLTKANLELLAEELKRIPEKPRKYIHACNISHSEDMKRFAERNCDEQKPKAFSLMELKSAQNGRKLTEISNEPVRRNDALGNILPHQIMDSHPQESESQLKRNLLNLPEQMSILFERHEKPSNDGGKIISHDKTENKVNTFSAPSYMTSDKDPSNPYTIPWRDHTLTVNDNDNDPSVMKPRPETLWKRDVETLVDEKRANVENKTRAITGSHVISFNGIDTNGFDANDRMNMNTSPYNILPFFSEDERRSRETDKDADSDINDTFTLDSLDNFDQEMKVWASKYLTKRDSQHSSFVGSDKILKPEILSNDTKEAELQEFEFTAEAGGIRHSEAEPYTTEKSFPSPGDQSIGQKSLSSCSSSSSSSDSITYVFVGKEEGEARDTNMTNVNSTSQYSSMLSSVSLDSLEKTGLQPKFLSCLSPRTLSIDSLVAEELLHQLRNGNLVPLSRNDHNEPALNETSRAKPNTISPSNLQRNVSNQPGPESKITSFNAKVTESFSPEGNQISNARNCFKFKSGSSGGKFCSQFDGNINAQIQTDYICNKQQNNNEIDHLRGKIIQEDYSHILQSDVNRPMELTHVSEVEHELKLFAENKQLDIGNQEQNLYVEPNLVIPPPNSFKTGTSINKMTRISKEVETDSRSTQTDEPFHPNSDIHKQSNNPPPTDTLQLALRMMELMTEILKYLKEQNNHGSNCCALRKHECDRSVRKKMFPGDSWSSSSNNSSESDQTSLREGAAKTHYHREITAEKNKQKKYGVFTMSGSEETSEDTRSHNEMKRRRRTTKRDNYPRCQPLDDYVRRQLLQLPSFAKELTASRENQVTMRKSAFCSNVLNNNPHCHYDRSTLSTDEASGLNGAVDCPKAKLTNFGERRRSTPKDHLKNLIEIRRRLVQETKHLRNNQGAVLHEDKNGSNSSKLLGDGKIHSSSSSEGYLSSLSSRGMSSHLSEVCTENRSHEHSPCCISPKTKTSRSLKSKPLMLDIHRRSQITPPSTSWQNTSADSGAFFMDSPLVERKDFIDIGTNLCGYEGNTLERISEATLQRHMSSVRDDSAELLTGECNTSSLTTKALDSNGWTSPTITDVESASMSAVTNTPTRSPKKSITNTLEEFDDEYKDIKMPVSILINKIPPKRQEMNSNLPKNVCNQTSSARTEFAEKLSDANYKITREDIERILISIENDKKFLRRKRNPILDRCYSPEITLNSPTGSKESLFSCDSYKLLPPPVLYLSTIPSGFRA